MASSHQAVDAGLGGQAGEGHVLLARADEDLQDGVHPVGDAGDGEDGQVRLRLADVAGELGHGPAAGR